MKERVTGMVLSAATIGEYDKRVVLLTKERGRISAFARGARRPRSPLSAATEPFTFGEFFIYRGRDSYSIEQVEVGNYFPELRQNLEHLYLALYFCEVADYFTREGMTAKHELNILYLSLRALSVPSLPEEEPEESWRETQPAVVPTAPVNVQTQPAVTRPASAATTAAPVSGSVASVHLTVLLLNELFSESK